MQNPIPELIGDALYVDGKPFLMLAGEVHNSSASSLEYMAEEVWPAVNELNCNSLIVPVYWELVEPEEGKFDFTLLDGLLVQARESKIRLVLLWFATWKNAWSTYTPEWVKRNTDRFFRTQQRPGENCGQISPFCTEAMEADARAFATLMRHLKEVDSAERTVIAVQVQNETGLLGASRDHSPAAEEAFCGSIPEKLTTLLSSPDVHMAPGLHAAWLAAGGATSGNWTHVFGAAADEAFMSSAIARYVQHVAAAGKREYPLPLFVNAWLVQYKGQLPGQYPSGGPVAHTWALWRALAPDLAFTAPDIYLPNFPAICSEYRAAGLPLFIPEACNDGRAASWAFCAFGEFQAACFAPFGIESMLDSTRSATIVNGNTVAKNQDQYRASESAGALLSETYAMLAELTDLLLDARGKKSTRGFCQTDNTPQSFELDGVHFTINFNHPLAADCPPAGGLLLSLGNQEFILAGFGFTLIPEAPSSSNATIGLLSMDEGRFVQGNWSPRRRLNGDEGDELGCRLESTPSFRRLRFYAYPRNS